MQKVRCLEIARNENQLQNTKATTQHKRKKTSRKLSEILRFQKDKILETLLFTTT